ncbi:ORF2 [Tanay virus]|nr:ORF2 [Tanay virus]AHX42606.1 ORF2 [Tanay virus]
MKNFSLWFVLISVVSGHMIAAPEINNDLPASTSTTTHNSIPSADSVVDLASPVLELPVLHLYKTQNATLNKVPLWQLKYHSNVYDSELSKEIVVHTANAWNKFIGYHCPPNHYKHVLQHEFFSDVYVCVKIPQPLKKIYTAYSLVQAYDSIALRCYSTPVNTIDQFYITIVDVDQWYLLKDGGGSEYLISKYCLNYWYQIDSHGNELFDLKFTVSKGVVTFHLPKHSCSPLKIDFSSANNILNVQIRGGRTLECIKRQLFRNYNYNCNIPYKNLTFTHNKLMLYRTDDCPSTLYESVESEDISIHVESSSGASPFSFITTALLQVMKPVLDFVLDSLMTIINEFVTIYESPEFIEIFTRIFDTFAKFVRIILDFITKPEIMNLFVHILETALKIIQSVLDFFKKPQLKVVFLRIIMIIEDFVVTTLDYIFKSDSVNNILSKGLTFIEKIIKMLTRFIKQAKGTIEEVIKLVFSLIEQIVNLIIGDEQIIKIFVKFVTLIEHTLMQIIGYLLKSNLLRDLINSVFTLLVHVSNIIFDFISLTIVPQVIHVFMNLSFKVKIMFAVFLICYIKSSKFFWSIVIALIFSCFIGLKM